MPYTYFKYLQRTHLSLHPHSLDNSTYPRASSRLCYFTLQLLILTLESVVPLRKNTGAVKKIWILCILLIRVVLLAFRCFIYICTFNSVSFYKCTRLIPFFIRHLPADTVAQSVERRRDKPRAWVQILASVRVCICTVAFFLLCYPCEALEGPNSTEVCII